MKEARIRKLLNEKAYTRAMDTYTALKKEGNIDILLFFKSFVYQCSRTNNIEFNSYLEDRTDVLYDIRTFYYPRYKGDNHTIQLYDTVMNGLFVQ